MSLGGEEYAYSCNLASWATWGKKLLTQYGERLVCVRYRYDEPQKKRFKTVELIVEESAWEPKVPRRASDDLVHIRVALPEGALRRRIKQAGGRWDPRSQLWTLRYDQVVALGLADRITGTGSL